jgi:hypothetical protein
MSIDQNVGMIPSTVRALVIIFAAIAVVLVGVAYMFSYVLGHFLWLVIGGLLVVVAVYLFLLRMKS